MGIFPGTAEADNRISQKTQSTLKIAPAPKVNKSAIISAWFAPRLSLSPRLRATTAETDTFKAINKASPKNFGCVVSPTAATA